MEVGSFSELEDEFLRRVQRIVWCTVASVDRGGRPRTRVLHPMWEGSTGYILTGRRSHKARHLVQRPYVSLCYWDSRHEIVNADCRAEWLEDAAERTRIWNLFASTPEPYGYDPTGFFQSPDNPAFGVLRLTPWRLELSSLGDMARGIPPRVWRQPA